MPPTGKELKVGDISEVEPNIHAGVKYMRFMIDRYYKDEPMDNLNKALMTFASYNAGPGRIRQLRRETEERGLDPNVWFGNVEQRRIGADRSRDRHLRQQHLQVLRRLPPAHRPARSDATRRRPSSRSASEMPAMRLAPQSRCEQRSRYVVIPRPIRWAVTPPSREVRPKKAIFDARGRWPSSCESSGVHQNP